MTYPTTVAVVREPGGPHTLEEAELDELQSHEVLVKIEACGICHTDVKFQERITLPGVFGHEGAGVVEALGSEVSGLEVGDRVVLSYPWCGHCPQCDHNEPFRCENIPALKFSGQRLDGTKPIRLNGEEISSAFFQQSSFATRSVVFENSIVKVETDLPAEMLAALPCGVQTGAGAVLNTFDIQSGQTVVVFGVGAVGLSAVMAAKMIGASTIVAVDVFQNRIDLAAELGATHIVDASSEDVRNTIKSILPQGANYALDCSATVAALMDSLEVIGQGGKIGIFSAPPPGQTFDFTTRSLFDKVGSLHGIVQGFSVPQDFIPKLIEFHKGGNFPYERMITTYPFEEIDRAMADAKSGAAIKPVLLMNS